MLRPTLALAAIILPATAFAVGSGDSSPPTPSETTTECAEGLVFDIATQSCLSPEESTNDDSAMYLILRELAYAGRYADAARVLEGFSDQSAPEVLTYYGFVARKTGDLPGALSYYAAALEADPDNLLARSYLGQAYVEMGEVQLASAELSQIRQRGGRNSWPELALRLAIESGQGFSY